MQQSIRSVLWTAIITILVLLFAFLGLLVSAYIGPFHSRTAESAAHSVLNSLGVVDAWFSEEEFAELEAQYGPAVEEVKRQAEGDIKRQRDELAAARAAVPDGAPISSDWDFRACLMPAWFPVEQEMLDVLSCGFLRWNTTADRNTAGAGSLDDATLYRLKNHLSSGREAGNQTHLETRFDPATQGGAAVSGHFREYVLTAPFLDEMEVAIDLGLCRHIRDLDEEEAKAFARRRATATRLLACRAISLQQQGDRQAALETIGRLYRLQAGACSDSSVVGDFDAYSPRSTAHTALRYILSEGPTDAAFRERTLACLKAQFEGDVFAARLRRSAVEGPQRNYRIGMRGEPIISFFVYKAFAWTEEVVILLERPFYEVEGEIDEAVNRLKPESLRESEKQEPEASLKDAVNAYKERLRFREGDGMDLVYECKDLVDMCRFYSRDTFIDSVVATAFALAEYKETNAEYPDSLDALVPEYLSAIPVDPATGGPLTLERTGDGYELFTPPVQEYTDIPDMVWHMAN